MGRGSSGAGSRAKGARASKGAGGGGGLGGSAGGASEGSRLPDASKATVKFSPDTSASERKEAKDVMTKLYGDKFTLQDFASAAGAPDNATVILDYSAPFHNIPAKFAVYIKAPELGEMTRTFTVDKRGRPIIKNDIFETVQTGTGLGLKLFSRQVNNATALGFKAIKTNAAREDGVFNGYSTWVKFGYNNKLDPGTRSILPPELKGARSMHELRQTQAGRDWWEANGTSTDMRFNLNPGSRSHRILKDYSAKKASQPPRPAPKPWSPPESQMFTL